MGKIIIEMLLIHLVTVLLLLPVFDAPQIAKDVVNKVVEVCKQWNSDPPCFYKSKMLYESYVHAIKNTRRKMEDKHVILPQYNSMFGFPQVTLFTR